MEPGAFVQEVAEVLLPWGQGRGRQPGQEQSSCIQMQEARNHPMALLMARHFPVRWEPSCLPKLLCHSPPELDRGEKT